MTKQEPEEVLNSEVEADIVETLDLDSLKQSLDTEKKRAEEYLANWQRAQADFINYKRRTEHEREELGKFANSILILSLLPTIDDLERALSSVPSRLAKLAWLDGIKLIEQNLKTTLKSQGLTPIEALGKPFDPSFHEAVRQVEGKEGIIIEELQKGYMLNNKLLRPSVVVVGNGEEAEEKEE